MPGDEDGDDRGYASRDEGGRWDRTFDDEAFVDAVNKLPVASTQNVADEVGCSYNLAYRRLKALEEEGQVESDTVRGSYVWLPVDD